MRFLIMVMHCAMVACHSVLPNNLAKTCNHRDGVTIDSAWTHEAGGRQVIAKQDASIKFKEKRAMVSGDECRLAKWKYGNICKGLCEFR